MIEQRLDFTLPMPWQDKRFVRTQIGVINVLVGPNGSGKSRFADLLRGQLPNSRLLGTDRLQGTGLSPLQFLYGDNLRSGYQKNWFQNLKDAGQSHGSGADVFVLLEERPDLRVKVEATLTSLFNRRITLEWDSGNLIPKATSGATGKAYRLDRDECHGIRELLVLLTHLYNDAHDYLIIDEPELNLHPQYQAFFMQEVRKIAGKPTPGTAKKVVFLITHSPFIIDLRSADDLASIISFSSDHAAPVSVDGVGTRLNSLIPRLNVHHKQLFFSDHPIFVEGVLDAQIIEAIQERRNFSITSAGSCIIDAGGCEEVNKYLELCRALKKSAYFLYDLDSLFIGNLRQCIKADGEISDFLADLGLGQDFSRYCGELDKKLGDAVAAVREATTSLPAIDELKAYIEGLTKDGAFVDKKALPKARVAILTDLHGRRGDIVPVIGAALAADIEGRLKKIIELLRAKNVFVLPGGALEHYLPSYSGHRYALEDSAKRAAVEAEVLALAQGTHDTELPARYGALYENIARLPAKPPVDTDTVLLDYLADYIHDLQGRVLANPEWDRDQLNAHFRGLSSGIGKLFEITRFVRQSANQFSATVQAIGSDGRIAEISHDTNAGMRRFELRAATSEAA